MFERIMAEKVMKDIKSQIQETSQIQKKLKFKVL